MTYYLFLEQAGEGCDYTIGCGKKLIKLPDGTAEQAKKKAIALLTPEELEWYTNKRHSSDDRVISKAIILSSVEELDIDSLYEHWTSIGERAEQDREDIRERKEYERLRDKILKGAK